MTDNVNHPSHYTALGMKCECGRNIEVIKITERLGFVVGNAVKYILRAPYKGSELEDLQKAQWYLKREIKRVKREAKAAAKAAQAAIDAQAAADLALAWAEDEQALAEQIEDEWVPGGPVVAGREYTFRPFSTGKSIDSASALREYEAPWAKVVQAQMTVYSGLLNDTLYALSPWAWNQNELRRIATEATERYFAENHDPQYGPWGELGWISEDGVRLVDRVKAALAFHTPAPKVTVDLYAPSNPDFGDLWIANDRAYCWTKSDVFASGGAWEPV